MKGPSMKDADTRIDLDWSVLLGFDQLPANADRGSIPNSAKISGKQMVRRCGEADSVAVARLTKVGI